MLTFDTPISIEPTTTCFLNKLAFVNRVNVSSTGVVWFRPSYPGSCQETQAPSMTITAGMDPRDFVLYLGLGMLNNLLTIDGMEMNFLPSININPIRELAVTGTMLSPAGENPSLIAFDIDWTGPETLVYLHFIDIMDLSTFNGDQLTLHNPINNMMLTLDRLSRPIGIQTNLVKTICVTLTSGDAISLNQMSVCTSRFGGCTCSFGSGLVSNYLGSSVQDVSPDSRFSVSQCVCKAARGRATS